MSLTITDIRTRLTTLLTAVAQVLQELANYGGPTRPVFEVYERALDAFRALNINHDNLQGMETAVAQLIREFPRWRPQGSSTRRGKRPMQEARGGDRPMQEARRFLRRRLAEQYLPTQDGRVWKTLCNNGIFAFEAPWAWDLRETVMDELEKTERSEKWHEAWWRLQPISRAIVDFIICVDFLKEGAGMLSDHCDK